MLPEKRNVCRNAALDCNTQSDEASELKLESGGSFVTTIFITEKFFQDVRAEMKLVVWPSRSEVMNTTLVVIMTTILFAVFLWLVDKGSERAVSLVLKTFAH